MHLPCGNKPVIIPSCEDSGTCNLSELYVSQNGDYTPPENYDGFSKAVVDLPTTDENFLIAIGEKVGSIYDTNESIVGTFGLTSRSNLTGVEMLNVISISDAAFEYCRSLKVAKFPKCETVGASAFNGCTTLTDIELPACKRIEYDDAFANCVALETITLPACVAVNAGAFYQCSNLKTVDIPVCSFIGADAFAACYALENINAPQVKLIWDDAFRACSALRSASFPSCELVGTGAFSRCTRLESLYLLSTSVASTGAWGSWMFESTPMSNSSYLGYYGSIYVPASLVDAYKAASGWRYYSDRITAYTGE